MVMAHSTSKSRGGGQAASLTLSETFPVASKNWGPGWFSRFLCLSPTLVLSGCQFVLECRTSIRISTMKLLREGQVVRQTYEVEKFLGEGAFAEVYRVRHRFFGRQALKVFKLAGMTREETEKMLGEAIILSRLGHPNIVRVFDADLVETSRGECAFFTMEYVAGGTLQDFWKSHGASFVPVETSVEILRQVCRGLAVAHAEKPPIVHRDIKPQNILVGYDKGGLRARVTDFGLAKRVNPLTLLASARGTMRFKSPEVFQNPKSDSCAGDVWALGCTLYLLLTDRLPYSDIDDEEFQRGTFVSTPLAAPSTIHLNVDPTLDAIALKALHPKPKQRYADAEQMLADLGRWKPRTKRAPSKESYTSEINKTALGPLSTPDAAEGHKLAEEAVKLARVHGKLNEAADLMEEALTKSPDLRDRYESSLQLWRKGIIM
jgi:serine/threonine-protein kinase